MIPDRHVVIVDIDKIEELNEYLKQVDSDYREKLIQEVLSGICKHCFDVVEGKCYCTYDD